MSEKFCGIDFGTSNSSIAVAGLTEKARLVPVEKEKHTIPSAIFYAEDKHFPVFGSEAVSAYILGEQGRFMRSLKRVLGTDLMSVGTQINGKQAKFENILTQFIQNLKQKAETVADTSIEKVVMGRPVHFRDNDAKGDRQAETELQNIAKAAGFKNIVFQYEPIAAAYAHEQNIEGEKLACVVDIGGGTSDFSIIRIGTSFLQKANRSQDILANSGIRIGGNDFDKSLSVCSFMPELGMGGTYGPQNLPVPTSQYFDLSEWSRVNSAYNAANRRIVKQVLQDAHDPQKYSRLLDVLECEKGHTLLGYVENAKIALTETKIHREKLNFIDGKPEITALRDDFENAIQHPVSKISHEIDECLRQAGIKEDEVEIIILTGGSTEIPYVKNQLCQRFKSAIISGENKLSSVGLGLACDSLRRFA